MASSSATSPCWKYDVFPSFSGEDVRQSFLSHLLTELKRKSVITFVDNNMERGCSIGPELKSAIIESRIAIVVFSTNYASSTWCLNELVEIHKCYEDLKQIVIPVFYNVDPSDVRKQTGVFGKAFEKTCVGKEDEKERWKEALEEFAKKALEEFANKAGFVSQNWTDEAKMIEQISKDVLNKLLVGSFDDFSDYVGIQAHIDEIMDSLLSLESEGARMVGIVGPSGIGKTTIASALYNRLSSRFPDHRVFGNYKRPIPGRKTADHRVKLSWAKKFLSDILCLKDTEVDSLRVVEQRLKTKKVLIVLDDVDELELLEALVGKPEWFGNGSRIVVVTQDRALLKSHEIEFIYEVELPSIEIALEMFCRSACRGNSLPDNFWELAVEVTKLAGNLPLGITVLGTFLSGMEEEEWNEMMPRLRDGLDGDIERTLRVSYDGLSRRDQDNFLSIACLFRGEEVNHIKNMLGTDAVKVLVNRSLISIRPSNDALGSDLRTLLRLRRERPPKPNVRSLISYSQPSIIPLPSTGTVEMHGLLEKLGREIVRVESIDNPDKRRFLMDAKEISDVFTRQDTGTKNVVGIYFDTPKISKAIDEKSFVGMPKLQFLKVEDKDWSSSGKILYPQGHVVCLPPNLRLLHWRHYPEKSLPSSFCGEYIVELIMMNSMLEKLWEGTKPLQNLKKMKLKFSRHLKDIPNLSNATNLEILDLHECQSLVELPSTIRNLKKLTELDIRGCSNLKVLPTVNLTSLNYLNLVHCSSLKSFPRISRNISRVDIIRTTIEEEESCLWIENLSGLVELKWSCYPLGYLPSKFNPEHLVELRMDNSKLEKLWEGVQPLQSLKRMILDRSAYLKEIPDLSNATNLEEMSLIGCTSLVELPSTIRNLKKLIFLDMGECSNLESLPIDVNLESLDMLLLEGCRSLESFPRISRNISMLNLSGIAIKEEKDCLWIENLSGLTCFYWENCPLRCLPSNFHTEHLVSMGMGNSMLERLWEGVQPLAKLQSLDLSGCNNLREFPDLSKANNLKKLELGYCTSLEVLPTNIDLVSLTSLDLSHCTSLEVLPDLSKATNLQELKLSYWTSLEVLPTNIINLASLTSLDLSHCTSLEVLPTNMDLAPLTTLDLSGCTRFSSLPQLSTSIKNLYLDKTAMEEVPSWIANMAGLTHFSMDCCRKLRKIPATVRNSDVDFSMKGCEREVKVSNASLLETLAELHPARTDYYTEKLTGVSRSTTKFLLARDAQVYILQKDFKYAAIPGEQVPTFFTHRDRGATLSVPLPEPESSLYKKKLEFAGCINLELPFWEEEPYLPGLLYPNDSIIIFVHWKFRGVKGICRIISGGIYSELDHQLVFHFDFENGEEVDDPPSQFDCNNLEFEFEAHRSPLCGCYTFEGTSNEETCLDRRLCKIKECGIQILSISPSLDANETDDSEQDGETNMEAFSKSFSSDTLFMLYWLMISRPK